MRKGCASILGGLFVLGVLMSLIGQCSNARDEKEHREAEARARERDSLTVLKATVVGAMPTGAAAVALDNIIHRRHFTVAHPSVHLAAVATHLDTAAALIARTGDPQAILAELAPASAGVPDSLKHRRDQLYARLKPRLDEAARKERAASRAAGTFLRKQFAKTYENNLLDQGFNATVTTRGLDATTLHVKWILVSRVVVHQFEQNDDWFAKLRKMEFKRFELTDGYDENWHWDLK